MQMHSTGMMFDCDFLVWIVVVDFVDVKTIGTNGSYDVVVKMVNCLMPLSSIDEKVGYYSPVGNQQDGVLLMNKNIVELVFKKGDIEIFG